jgi:hypothetical protein
MQRFGTSTGLRRAAGVRGPVRPRLVYQEGGFWSFDVAGVTLRPVSWLALLMIRLERGLPEEQLRNDH